MEPQKEKNLKGKIVETYTADMAKVITGGSGMYIKKIIEEQEQIEKEKENLSPESKKNKKFMFSGILLLIVGLGILVFFAFFKDNITSVEIAPTFSPVIYLDGIDFIDTNDLNKDKIIQTIFNKTTEINEVKKGGIEGVYLKQDKKILGLRGFLKIIAPDLDQSKMTFVSDDFLIGLTNQEYKKVFILIRARSFADVFDPMRLWEKTMFNDLHGIFGVPLNSSTKYLLTKDFENHIVSNRNAKILKDAEGNIVMMYVFIDDTNVLITNDRATVKEMQSRLSAGTIKK